LLLFKDGGGQDHAFAALFDSCAQKQCAQVLLDGAGADLQFRRDVFVAAPLDQQLQHLLIAAGDFDLLQIDHVLPPGRGIEFWGLRFEIRESTSFAKASPLCTEGQVPADASTSGRTGKSAVITNFVWQIGYGTSCATMKKRA
jgi:hypothetical protein